MAIVPFNSDRGIYPTLFDNMLLEGYFFFPFVMQESHHLSKISHAKLSSKGFCDFRDSLLVFIIRLYFLVRLSYMRYNQPFFSHRMDLYFFFQNAKIHLLVYHNAVHTFVFFHIPCKNMRKNGSLMK